MSSSNVRPRCWNMSKLCDSCRKLLASEGGGTFHQLLIGVEYLSQFSTAVTCCNWWIFRPEHSFILPHTDDRFCSLQQHTLGSLRLPKYSGAQVSYVWRINQQPARLYKGVTIIMAAYKTTGGVNGFPSQWVVIHPAGCPVTWHPTWRIGSGPVIPTLGILPLACMKMVRGETIPEEIWEQQP